MNKIALRLEVMRQAAFSSILHSMPHAFRKVRDAIITPGERSAARNVIWLSGPWTNGALRLYVRPTKTRLALPFRCLDEVSGGKP